MPRHWFAAFALLIFLQSSAVCQERLSNGWKTNSQNKKNAYYTAEEMPSGSELRIKVQQAGKVDVLVFDYRDGGRSPEVKRFSNVTAGQVLKYKLERKMRVGIIVGSPLSATCAGCEDKGKHHVLTFDFGNLGTYVFDAKVISEEF